MAMRRAGFLVLTFLFLGAQAEPALAGCAVANGVSLPGVDFFDVTGSFADSFLNTSISRWETKCPDYGHDYPDMEVNSGTGLPIQVNFFNRARDDNLPGDRCETTIVHRDNDGEMTGATINIWAQRRGGDACKASTEDLVVHGLGHALGFDDAFSDACQGTIMGQPIPGQQMQILDDHCNMLDFRWQTLVEDDPCRDPEASRCECDPWEPCTPSPIVLDLARNGFTFSGQDDPVWFDLDADGLRELVTWTGRGSDDAFLALDRDGDHRIEHGAELFGNFTRLGNGLPARHGYEALAELDTSLWGGNGDGVLNADDGTFGRLRAWVDRNHNGRSEADELVSLETLGIVRLDLTYVTNRQRDRHGNLLRYNSKAWVKHGDREFPIRTTDVFFREVSP